MGLTSKLVSALVLLASTNGIHPSLPLQALQAPTSSPTDASPTPAFQVATIKPAHPSQSSISFAWSADSLSITHASLRDLIRSGWGLRTNDQVEQGPAWIGSEYYDVSAKMSESDAAALAKLDRDARFDARRRMLQALVTDRFHVQVTLSTETRPAYALTVGKKGPKLKESASPAGGASPASRPSLRFREDHLIATNYSMASFAAWLSAQPAVDRRMVVDQTGLIGNYDFTLDGWYPRTEQPLDATSAEEDQGKPLFAVLEDQLGLKLVSAKAPVPIVIVEHAEPPSPN